MYMGKAKILVVNDSLAQRAIFKDVLEENGYSVVEAGDGKEGIAKTRAESPDVIITDVSMPNMDGLQMIRLLKSEDRTKYIPIICVSATFQDLATKLRALTEVGAEEYFYVPQNTGELIAKVTVMLRIRKIYKDLISQNKALKEFTDACVVKDFEIIDLKKKVAGLEAELKKYKK
jgi:DNA-binding response OmpR family regulator